MRHFLLAWVMLVCASAAAQVNPNVPKPQPKPKPAAAPVASAPMQFTGNSSILVVVDADGVLSVDYEKIGKFREGETWKSPIMAGSHAVELRMGEDRWEQTVECKSGQQLIVKTALAGVRQARIQRQPEEEARQRAEVEAEKQRRAEEDRRAEVEQMIFKEDFDRNANNWLAKETDGFSMKIEGGKYSITSKKGGMWYSTIPVLFDRSMDCEISATIRKVAGTDRYYFGMMMGFDPDSSKRWLFAGITGQGNAVFARKSGDTSADLIGGEIYREVRTGNAENKISVIKTGPLFKLYINDQLIGTTSGESLAGPYFGLCVWSGTEYLSIDIDELTIR
jgi:hypothetical protein